MRGVGGYGNSPGLPNIGGETVFDASYAGNPLVNALCAGVLRTEDLKLAFASGAGNQIILFGARTGLDGIGGVSVLASETFGDDGGDGPSRKKLPSVQVGDPFTEKVLIECCLDLYRGTLSSGSRTSAAPASRARRRSWPPPVTAVCIDLERCRCARRG